MLTMEMQKKAENQLQSRRREDVENELKELYTLLEIREKLLSFTPDNGQRQSQVCDNKAAAKLCLSEEMGS